MNVGSRSHADHTGSPLSFTAQQLTGVPGRREGVPGPVCGPVSGTMREGAPGCRTGGGASANC